MRSRRAIFGVAGIVVLTMASLLGTLSGSSAMQSVASTLLVAMVGILVIDATVVLRRTERQVRRTKSVVREIASRGPRPRVTAKAAGTHPREETLPATNTADLIGTIRILQAQYVGRLDRMQAALDAAIERIPATDRQE